MCPRGLVYWGRGLTINGLCYSGTCPFPQTPIPLRFFYVPYSQYFASEFRNLFLKLFISIL